MTRKLFFFLVIVLPVFAVLSCKKDKDCDSTTATVRFENTSPEDLWVEISRIGELDAAFREVDKTIAIPPYGDREEDLTEGVRFIRWARCSTGGGSGRCTEVSIKEADYKACEEYTEQPLR